jgi:hypothetical protein
VGGKWVVGWGIGTEHCIEEGALCLYIQLTQSRIIIILKVEIKYEDARVESSYVELPYSSRSNSRRAYKRVRVLMHGAISRNKHSCI